MSTDLEEQEDELVALQSIFSNEEFVRDESKFAGTVRVSAELPADFTVFLKAGKSQRQYKISFLPPLLLSFELPEDYPSSSPPSFTLTCSWLTHTQLDALSAQLVEVYQANCGNVILFSWVQFLREEALKFLGICNELEVASDSSFTLQDIRSAAAPQVKNNSLTSGSKPADGKRGNAKNRGKRGGSAPASVPSSNSVDQLSPAVEGAASLLDEAEDSSQDEEDPSQALPSQILSYDALQKQKVFDGTVFDCGVCYLSYLGSECVQLSECGHIFCQTCLGEFCKFQITEGNVRNVSCPQADCTATPTPAQVLTLVGEELFSRYDRLMLQTTLDCMSDVAYCPRPSCAAAVIQEKSSTLAMCSVCGFAFCVKCKKTYHGTDECEDKKIKEKEEYQKIVGSCLPLPESQEGRSALWDDYNTGSKARKRLLENRYGRKTLMVFLESGLSDGWIEKNSKPCPHCSRKIEKNGGCNRMYCTQCHHCFCWACLTVFSAKNTSTHFQDGSCILFP
ncbi:E3 ubiquitin-protein ligase RNF14-like [Salarias fasciatus]|uniref:RBR-type E3 ubiquitin transferase n=1 Tax=Salarias fasciatus TaxID=181472 RepID=A0A672I7C2_SALFA|nr:E3 ubiquitin-protein ligase RNF14-like [Salarias fasciatus]